METRVGRVQVGLVKDEFPLQKMTETAEVGLGVRSELGLPFVNFSGSI